MDPTEDRFRHRVSLVSSLVGLKSVEGSTILYGMSCDASFSLSQDHKEVYGKIPQFNYVFAIVINAFPSQTKHSHLKKHEQVSSWHELQGTLRRDHSIFHEGTDTPHPLRERLVSLTLDTRLKASSSFSANYSYYTIKRQVLQPNTNHPSPVQFNQPMSSSLSAHHQDSQDNYKLYGLCRANEQAPYKLEK